MLRESLEAFLDKRLVDFPEFLVANLGHARLLLDLPHPVRVFADNAIPVMNHLAANALFEQGFSAVTLSEECDADTFRFFNMSKLAGGKYLFYFSGKPAVCTSRMRPSASKDPFVSNKGESFSLLWHEEEYSTLHPTTRYFLSSIYDKEFSPDILGFIMDLRHEENPIELGRALMAAVREGETFKKSPLGYRTELQPRGP
jgi:hypothetical protein